MSTADTTRGARLVGGGLLVAAALGVGQVLGYAQTLVAARVLSPAEFGAFSALLALLLIGNTVALATQAVTARHIVAADRRLLPGSQRSAFCRRLQPLRRAYRVSQRLQQSGAFLPANQHGANRL